MSPTMRFTRTFKRNITKGFLVMLALALFPASLSAAVLVVTGSDAGNVGLVRVFTNGIQAVNILPYGKTFRGGVRVALGDVNGDGVIDIVTVPGPGFEPLVGVFDGNTGKRLTGRIGGFLAYPSFLRGGLFVAAGDVNGDGKADVIVVPDGRQTPTVRVFDGATGDVLSSFFAFSPTFLGGVRVAAGDVNGDGTADIIVGAGPGANPHVKVFNGNGVTLKSFFAFNAGFHGGVFVAAGDVNGDGRADIITGAGPGGGPHVAIFDGLTGQTLDSFFAFTPNFQGGVRVGAGDVNGDGRADIIVGGGPNSLPHVRVLNSVDQTQLHGFLAYEQAFRGGIFVAGGGH